MAKIFYNKTHIPNIDITIKNHDIFSVGLLENEEYNSFILNLLEKANIFLFEETPDGNIFAIQHDPLIIKLFPKHDYIEAYKFTSHTNGVRDLYTVRAIKNITSLKYPSIKILKNCRILMGWTL